MFFLPTVKNRRKLFLIISTSVRFYVPVSTVSYLRDSNVEHRRSPVSSTPKPFQEVIGPFAAKRTLSSGRLHLSVLRWWFLVGWVHGRSLHWLLCEGVTCFLGFAHGTDFGYQCFHTRLKYVMNISGFKVKECVYFYGVPPTRNTAENTALKLFILMFDFSVD
jgi:hypothetical protein